MVRKTHPAVQMRTEDFVLWTRAQRRRVDDGTGKPPDSHPGPEKEEDKEEDKK